MTELDRRDADGHQLLPDGTRFYGDTRARQDSVHFTPDEQEYVVRKVPGTRVKFPPWPKET